jgi:hypothetical protein
MMTTAGHQIDQHDRDRELEREVQRQYHHQLLKQAIYAVMNVSSVVIGCLYTGVSPAYKNYAQHATHGCIQLARMANTRRIQPVRLELVVTAVQTEHCELAHVYNVEHYSVRIVILLSIMEAALL